MATMQGTRVNKNKRLSKYVPEFYAVLSASVKRHPQSLAVNEFQVSRLCQSIHSYVVQADFQWVRVSQSC